MKRNKTLCIRGHDTLIVGVNKRNDCRSCIKMYDKNFYLRHKNKIIKRKTLYCFNKTRTNPLFRLERNLRRRITIAIEKGYKSGSAVRDLGCSIPELKQYIESKFYSNMSWDNWGSVWELDHINELHTFNLKNKKQFKHAVHYTNLQPLTVEDHKKKTFK